MKRLRRRINFFLSFFSFLIEGIFVFSKYFKGISKMAMDQFLLQRCSNERGGERKFIMGRLITNLE